jgi:hypothetical protein
MKGNSEMIAEQDRMRTVYENLVGMFVPLVAAGTVSREVAVEAFRKHGMVYPDLSTTIRQAAVEPSEPAPATPAIYTPPSKSGKAHIYLSALPVTAAQKSWLRGNGFRELAITPADLQELLWKGKG